MTDFSICESCCCGYVESQGQLVKHGVDAVERAQNARSRLTFLGVRLWEPWEPCEERIEVASSVMAVSRAGVQRRREWMWLR